MNLLVLAPHTDDAELGCGGTIARYIEEGWAETEVAFSIGTADRSECEAAAMVLGIDGLVILDYPTRRLHEHRQEILQNLVDLPAPDLVMCPSWTDMHQDHCVVAQEAQRAFRRTTLVGYELPWNQTTTLSTLLVKLEHSHVRVKAAAFECYESQRERLSGDPEWIWALAKVRGLQAGAQYAEGFEVMRWVR